jgi:hypothetical protein
MYFTGSIQVKINGKKFNTSPSWTLKDGIINNSAFVFNLLCATYNIYHAGIVPTVCAAAAVWACTKTTHDTMDDICDYTKNQTIQNLVNEALNLPEVSTNFRRLPKIRVKLLKNGGMGIMPRRDSEDNDGYDFFTTPRFLDFPKDQQLFIILHEIAHLQHAEKVTPMINPCLNGISFLATAGGMATFNFTPFLFYTAQFLIEKARSQYEEFRCDESAALWSKNPMAGARFLYSMSRQVRQRSDAAMARIAIEGRPRIHSLFSDLRHICRNLSEEGAYGGALDILLSHPHAARRIDRMRQIAHQQRKSLG